MPLKLFKNLTLALHLLLSIYSLITCKCFRNSTKRFMKIALIRHLQLENFLVLQTPMPSPDMRQGMLNCHPFPMKAKSI